MVRLILVSSRYFLAKQLGKAIFATTVNRRRLTSFRPR